MPIIIIIIIILRVTSQTVERERETVKKDDPRNYLFPFVSFFGFIAATFLLDPPMRPAVISRNDPSKIV